MNGVGPPQQAAAQGNLEVMSVLMKAGGNLNTRSLDGATPLFMAAQKGNMNECSQDDAASCENEPAVDQDGSQVGVNVRCLRHSGR